MLHVVGQMSPFTASQGASLQLEYQQYDRAYVAGMKDKQVHVAVHLQCSQHSGRDGRQILHTIQKYYGMCLFEREIPVGQG